jgi:hypothetical protein
LAGPILYSTNPWIIHDIVSRYRNGEYYVWCSEHYNPAGSAAPGSSDAAIAPSSSPKGIYDQLWADCDGEDTHSNLIKGYTRTIKRLTAGWVADGSMTSGQSKEIVTIVKSKSWKIWRPVLFVIPKNSIDPARINAVPRNNRAAHGPEFQIFDLKANEFDLIER